MFGLGIGTIAILLLGFTIVAMLLLHLLDSKGGGDD